MTKAAKRLMMTQSAVSQAIGSLERGLGASLIERGTRPLLTTPAGSILLERGRSLLADVSAIPAAVRAVAGYKVSRLRLSVVSSVASVIGVELAAELRPLVLDLSVAIESHRVIDARQLSRDIDMLITVERFDRPAEAESHTILEEPFLVAVSDDHSVAQPSLQELLGMELVRYSENSGMGRLTELHLRRLKAQPRRGVAFDSSEAVVGTVRTQGGWAILTPLCWLQAGGSASGVRLVPFPGPGFRRRVVVMSRVGQFGQLPAQVAAIARNVIERRLQAENLSTAFDIGALVGPD